MLDVLKRAYMCVVVDLREKVEFNAFIEELLL